MVFKSKDSYDKWNRGRFLGLKNRIKAQQKYIKKGSSKAKKRKGKPKVSGRIKNLPKKNLTSNQVEELFSKAQRIHGERPESFQLIDENLYNRVTVTADDERANTWFAGSFGSADLIGVDDFESVKGIIKERPKALPKQISKTKKQQAKKRSSQKGKTKAQIREDSIITELMKRGVINDPQSINAQDLVDMKLTPAENRKEVLKLFGNTGIDRSNREKDLIVPQKDAILRFLNLPEEQQKTDLKTTRKPTYTNANLDWYNDPKKSDIRTIDTKGDYKTRRKQLQQVAKEKQQEENLNEWRKRITRLENKPRKTAKEEKELVKLEKRLMM